MRYKVTLPLPPSSNHMYVRRYKVYYKNGKKRKRLMNVLSDRAQEWMADSGDKCLQAMIDSKWECREKGTKVVAELYVYWPDHRKRDVHNLHKLLADCLEGRVCKDDQWLLLRDMDFDYDTKNPRLEVICYDRDS